MKIINKYEIEYKTISTYKFMTVDVKEDSELLDLINELLKKEEEKIEEIVEIIYLGEFYKEIIKVTDIIWDIDLEEDEEYQDAVKVLKLPETVTLEVDIPDDEDIDYIVADRLTEEYEFCVVGFTIQK